MDFSVESLTLRGLTLALDAAARQHAHLAHNIANANTEGFMPHRLSFPGFLEASRQLDQGRPLTPNQLRAISEDLNRPAQHQIQVGSPAPVRLDAEVAAMARNAVHFQALLKGVSSHFGLLAVAVADGKR